MGLFSSFANSDVGMASNDIFGGGSRRRSQDIRDTNRTNLRIATEANVASAEQAARQMEFQERMSNTSHQREVADLIGAGLNPMLSSGGGGSSTPAGAMGTVHVPKMEAPYGSFQGYGKGLMELASSAVGINKTDSDIQKVRAETVDALNRAGISGTQLREAEATMSAMQNEGGVFTMSMNEKDHALTDYMRATVTKPAVQAAAAKMAEQSNEEALQKFINMPAANATMQALQMAIRLYLSGKSGDKTTTHILKKEK